MGSAFGVLLHALGGVSAASFYVPYKSVKAWPWELYWIIGGFFSWIVVPLLLCVLTTEDLSQIFDVLTWENMAWPFFFGLLWGIGGLTFGLTVKYLGISLGIPTALGLTAAFGTLLPPVFDGSIHLLLDSFYGKLVLFGIFVSLVGTAVIGRAGFLRDKNQEVTAADDGQATRNVKLGITFAVISGLLSACFAFGIASGDAISKGIAPYVSNPLFVNSVLFTVIMFGGFLSNFAYCFFTIVRKKSLRGVDLSASKLVRKNLFFCALGGTIWYTQFLFYGMGTTQMQDLEFASWSLHMSFIIFFSTVWGVILKEWKGASRPVKLTLYAGLLLLVGSTILIGLGNSAM